MRLAGFPGSIRKYKMLFVCSTCVSFGLLSAQAQVKGEINADEILSQVLSHQASIPPYVSKLDVRSPLQSHPGGITAEILVYEMRIDGPKKDVLKSLYHEVGDRVIPITSTRTLWTGKQYQSKQTWSDSTRIGLSISSNESRMIKVWSSAYAGGPLSGYILFSRKPVAQVLKESGTSMIHTQMEEIDGHICYLIEGTVQERHYQIWVDPEYGYNIRKIVAMGPPNIDDPDIKVILKDELDHVKIEKIGDHYMPVAGTFTSCSGKDKDNLKNPQMWEYQRSDIRFNPDFEKMDAFVMDAPDGTRVRNDDLPSMRYEWRNGKAVLVIGNSF